MQRNIIIGLIVLAVVGVIVLVVWSTGPRYDPKNPNATPTPSQSSQ